MIYKLTPDDYQYASMINSRGDMSEAEFERYVVETTGRMMADGTALKPFIVTASGNLYPPYQSKLISPALGHSLVPPLVEKIGVSDLPIIKDSFGIPKEPVSILKNEGEVIIGEVQYRNVDGTLGERHVLNNSTVAMINGKIFSIGALKWLVKEFEKDTKEPLKDGEIRVFHDAASYKPWGHGEISHMRGFEMYLMTHYPNGLIL